MTEILTDLFNWLLILAGTATVVALVGIGIGYIHLNRRTITDVEP